MKQILTTALAVALTITASVFVTSCSNDPDDALASGSFAAGDGSTVAITFAVQGDFTLSTAPVTRAGSAPTASAPGFTRAALTADGRDMTDLWCLDYVGGVLRQTVHQTSDMDDFGQPTVALTIGAHHLYFIASRGTSPTLDTEAHTLSFTKVLDTFYKDYEITITSGTSSGSRAVTLDRVVTRLKLVFSDAVPNDAATINFAPHIWHYGWDYIAAAPANTKTDQTVVLSIPTSELGKTGLQANLYGFSSTTEWTTDIDINSKRADETIIGQATITDAPFMANRSSDYTGRLFTDGGGWTVSLNADWTAAHEGSW